MNYRVYKEIKNFWRFDEKVQFLVFSIKIVCVMGYHCFKITEISAFLKDIFNLSQLILNVEIKPFKVWKPINLISFIFILKNITKKCLTKDVSC